MMKLLCILLASLLFLAPSLHAEEPEPGKLHRVKLESGIAVSWILSGNAGTGWRLRVTDDVRSLVDAQLGRCSFCAGEEDNCAMNGIFVREIAGFASPLALAVCHVGAHSQQLQLFDPDQSSSTPALRITGSYFIDWSINARGQLEIEWDGDGNHVPGCDVRTDNSREFAPAQNRLLIDSPCYRTGSPGR